MSDRAQGRGESLAGERLVWSSVAGTAAVSLLSVLMRLFRPPGELRLPEVLQDGWLFALALAVALLAPAVASGARDRTRRSQRAAGAAFALGAGLALGLAKAACFVLANRYLALGMVRLTVVNAAAIVGVFCLAALAVFACAVMVPAVLPAVARSTRGRRLVSGLLPTLVIFAFVGYHLNRTYLPGLLEPLSLVVNALWLTVCAAMLWPLGWLSQRIGSLAERAPSGLLAGSAALLAVALGLVAIALPALVPERPNVILVSIDTLRADHLGSYGYRRPTSPSLDRFAAEAVLFRNAIAQASWTLPSHMSILTGLYPSGHGAVTPVTKLPTRIVTLAEILQQEGYRTVAITDGGYLDESYGYQGFDHFDDDGRAGARGAGLATAPRESNVRERDAQAAGLTVDKALRLLRSGRFGRPFFLFLHTYQVHCPYDPLPEWDRFSDPSYQYRLNLNEGCEDDFEAIKSSMSAAAYQEVIDNYDGEIAYTDAQLGRLFDELKAQGLYETSLIVVTADHGENFADHPERELGHTTLFDHTLRVPLIIKAPGQPAGGVVDATVESVDILPTVLDLLGIRLPERVDGASLRPTIATGTRQHGFAHSELHNPSGAMATRMVRSDSWKLICTAQNKCGLFDLAADPGEHADLLAARPEVALELRRYFDAWAAEQDRRLKAVDAEAAEIDDDLMKKLKALGYIQ